jgi:hypothetical protein
MTAVMPQYLPRTSEREMDYRSASPQHMADRNDFGIHTHRKAISTGGGRAWTDEEVREAFLGL